MDNGLTEVVCVVDRSGSMASLREDAIGGLNTFVEDQKQQEGEARFSLALFNEGYELVHDGIDLQDVPPLTSETYVPLGGTALLDALGKTIDSVAERLGADRRPVIFVILTDGLENRSRQFTREQIAEKIRAKREDAGWEFVFLAANQDAFLSARSMGMNENTSDNYEETTSGLFGALRSAGSAVGSYRATGQVASNWRDTTGASETTPPETTTDATPETTTTDSTSES